MVSTIDYFEELESAQGRNEKERILRIAAKSDCGELLRQVFYLVDDPYVNFGVSKFKMPKSAHLNIHDDDVIANFITLLDDLNDRKLTGNAARDAVTDAFSQMNERQQKWCQRIVLRNMRVGVQASTTEKVWPGIVNHFSVALAGKLQVKLNKETGKMQILSKLSYPVYCDAKLDGLRCIAVKHNCKVTLYSRSGKEIVTCKPVREALEKTYLDDFVLDGEMLGSKEGDWNAAASVIMSDVNTKDDSEVTYNVFDEMSYDDWMHQECGLPFKHRTLCVKQRVEEIASEHVKYVEPKLISSDDELFAYYVELLDNNFEGIMVKDANSPYIFDRSDAVMKFKPVSTYEGIIVGWYHGRKGTSREFTLGGFEVVFENGIVTRIGSGSMKAAFQAEVMLNPDSFIGCICEVIAQPDPLTNDGFTKDGHLRFPRFCRMRDLADVDQKIIEIGKKYFDEKNS